MVGQKKPSSVRLQFGTPKLSTPLKKPGCKNVTKSPGVCTDNNDVSKGKGSACKPSVSISVASQTSAPTDTPTTDSAKKKKKKRRRKKNGKSESRDLKLPCQQCHAFNKPETGGCTACSWRNIQTEIPSDDEKCKRDGLQTNRTNWSGNEPSSSRQGSISPFQTSTPNSVTKKTQSTGTSTFDSSIFKPPLFMIGKGDSPPESDEEVNKPVQPPLPPVRSLWKNRLIKPSAFLFRTQETVSGEVLSKEKSTRISSTGGYISTARVCTTQTNTGTVGDNVSTARACTTQTSTGTMGDNVSTAGASTTRTSNGTMGDTVRTAGACTTRTSNGTMGDTVRTAGASTTRTSTGTMGDTVRTAGASTTRTSNGTMGDTVRTAGASTTRTSTGTMGDTVRTAGASTTRTSTGTMGDTVRTAGASTTRTSTGTMGDNVRTTGASTTRTSTSTECGNAPCSINQPCSTGQQYLKIESSPVSNGEYFVFGEDGANGDGKFTWQPRVKDELYKTLTSTADSLFAKPITPISNVSIITSNTIGPCNFSGQSSTNGKVALSTQPGTTVSGRMTVKPRKRSDGAKLKKPRTTGQFRGNYGQTNVATNACMFGNPGMTGHYGFLGHPFIQGTGFYGHPFIPCTDFNGHPYLTNTGFSGQPFWPGTGFQGPPYTPNTRFNRLPNTPITGFQGLPTTPNTGFIGFPKTPSTGFQGLPTTPNTGFNGFPNTLNTGFQGLPTIPVTGNHGHPCRTKTGNTHGKHVTAGVGEMFRCTPAVSKAAEVGDSPIFTTLTERTKSLSFSDAIKESRHRTVATNTSPFHWDVVDLCVGDKTFLNVNLALLTREKDSELAEMFTGRSPVARNSAGQYILPGNGECFTAILNYLLYFELPIVANDNVIRENRGVSGSNFWTREQILTIYRMAETYGLKELYTKLEFLEPVHIEVEIDIYKTQITGYDEILADILSNLRMDAISQSNSFFDMVMLDYSGESRSETCCEHECWLDSLEIASHICSDAVVDNKLMTVLCHDLLAAGFDVRCDHVYCDYICKKDSENTTPVNCCGVSEYILTFIFHH